MYQIEMLLMFIPIFREDEEVVDVHPYKDPQWSRRTSFTTRWNVDGALQRPKGITTHSKEPNCVLKAVFSISSSWIRIWWNPLTRSIFENAVEPPSVLKMAWINGKGYRSRTFRVFNTRDSTHIRHLPFAFFTSRQPAPYGLEDGLIRPERCNLSNCRGS